MMKRFCILFLAVLLPLQAWAATIVEVPTKIAVGQVTEVLEWNRLGYVEIPEGAEYESLVIHFEEIVYLSAASAQFEIRVGHYGIACHEMSPNAAILLGKSVISGDLHRIYINDPKPGRWFFATRTHHPNAIFRNYRVRPVLNPSRARVVASPKSVEVEAGQPAKFEVTAKGTAPLTYQWFGNGKPIPGATSATYEIRSAREADDNLTFFCEVNNVRGVKERSATATLRVVAPVRILTHPQSQNKRANESVTFSVVASGLPAPTYQWYKNDARISGATSATYHIARVSKYDEGDYKVQVQNTTKGKINKVESATARLEVDPPLSAPIIHRPPISATRGVGESVAFNVTASGNPPPAYQWRKGNSDIEGATGNSYSISGLRLSDAGAYSVRVWNSQGEKSASATLTITPEPSPRLEPHFLPYSLSYSALVDDSVVLRIPVGGDPYPQLQWHKDGQPIAGATGAFHIISRAQLTDAGQYHLTAQNEHGAAISGKINLTVTTPAETMGILWETTFPTPGRTNILTSAKAQDDGLLRGDGISVTASQRERWRFHATMDGALISEEYTAIRSAYPTEDGGWITSTNSGANHVLQKLNREGVAEWSANIPWVRPLQPDGNLRYRADQPKLNSALLLVQGGVSNSYTFVFGNSSEYVEQRLVSTNINGQVHEGVVERIWFGTAIDVLKVYSNGNAQAQSRMLVDFSSSEWSGINPQYRHAGTSVITDTNGSIYASLSLIRADLDDVLQGRPIESKALVAVLEPGSSTPFSQTLSWSGSWIDAAVLKALSTGGATLGVAAPRSTVRFTSPLHDVQIALKPFSQIYRVEPPSEMNQSLRVRTIYDATDDAMQDFLPLRDGGMLLTPRAPSKRYRKAREGQRDTQFEFPFEVIDLKEAPDGSFAAIGVSSVQSNWFRQLSVIGLDSAFEKKWEVLLDEPYRPEDRADTFRIWAAQTNATFLARSEFGPNGALKSILRIGPIRPPRVLEAPKDQEVVVGEAVNFRVVASAQPPPTFQWFKNEDAIVGATNSTFDIAAAGSADAGLYSVTVTSGSETVTAVARLNFRQVEASSFESPPLDTPRILAQGQILDDKWSVASGEPVAIIPRGAIDLSTSFYGPVDGDQFLLLGDGTKAGQIVHRARLTAGSHRLSFWLADAPASGSSQTFTPGAQVAYSIRPFGALQAQTTNETIVETTPFASFTYFEAPFEISAGGDYEILLRAIPGRFSALDAISLLSGDAAARDRVAPLVAHVAGRNRSIRITFNEPVDAQTIWPGNFEVSGLSVDSVEMISEQTVRLSTTPQTARETYIIAVTGVTDLAGNEISSATLVEFSSDPVLAEYYFNADPGPGNGIPVPLTSPGARPTSFAFEVPEGVLAALPNGTHTLFCRVVDDNDNWSIAYARPFFKEEPVAEVPAPLIGIEYFIGADPGRGAGQFSVIAPSVWTGDFASEIPVAALQALSTGSHTIGVRVRDSGGRWSVTYARPFYKHVPVAEISGLLSAIEYFISSDPGPGHGQVTQLAPLIRSGDFGIELPSMRLASILAGTHSIAVRVQDEIGRWSVASTRPFFKDEARPEPPAMIESVELQWFAEQLPLGPIAVSRANPSAKVVALDPFLPTDGMTLGETYKLVAAAVDSRGRKGFPAMLPVAFEIQSQPEPPTLAAVRRLPDGSLTWTVSGAQGFGWKIQTSTDLINWTDLESVAPAESHEVKVVPDAARYRFYRAALAVEAF